MQELEAKFFVLDLKKIEVCLQELEAHLIQPRSLETNIRFDLPDNCLSSEGHILRLRQDTEARLTYKSAGINESGVLNRTEIEFVVENFEKAKQFLEALGYQRLFYYEKYRTTYALDSNSLLLENQKQASGIHNCHIMLDELPYGNFVEIEGESIESIQAVANKLNLKWDTTIPTSYHALFERLCVKHPNLDATDLSFNTLQGQTITADELSVHAADA